MPVKKSPDGKKWCFGKNCSFGTKTAALKAQKAYYSQKNKKVEKTMDKITIEKPEEILKATSDDIRTYLYDAVKESFVFDEGNVWGVDYDEKYLYFTVHYYGKQYYEVTYRLEYELDGVNVSLSDDLTEVKKETVYTEVKKDVEKSFIQNIDQKISEGIQKAFNLIAGKKDNKDLQDIPIIKQFEEEEQIAIEVMYSFPNEPDAHGEYMTSSTIEKMVISANKMLEEGKLSCGLFHQENRDDIEILKVWQNPCDCMIGETFVPEGSALMKTKFHNDDLWAMRKAGELKGVSIGARGKRITNE